MKNIEKDITRAETLPASFYLSRELFMQSADRIFARSWQMIGAGDFMQQAQNVFPFMLLPAFMNEPLILVKTEQDEVNCFSNVCTHRGNILVHHAGSYRKLICDYHGRKFSTGGQFESMPEFTEAKDFPRHCEDLQQVASCTWNRFPFVSLDPAFDFKEVTAILDRYTGFMPVSQFRYAPEFSKEYLVNAHWALYCDNYLEGFHIPFVHPELNKVLDYKNYETILFDHCNLQVGVADESSDHFELPEGHIDHGKKIAAYYFWIFPNLMLNFYPWGLSINIVRPLSEKQCKVSFLSYIYDEAKFEKEGADMLDKVEREDEYVVENVQRGIRSRFYNTGRFSPSREKGVHHFHTLISTYMNGEQVSGRQTAG